MTSPAQHNLSNAVLGSFYTGSDEVDCDLATLWHAIGTPIFFTVDSNGCNHNSECLRQIGHGSDLWLIFDGATGYGTVPQCEVDHMRLVSSSDYRASPAPTNQPAPPEPASRPVSQPEQSRPFKVMVCLGRREVSGLDGLETLQRLGLEYKDKAYCSVEMTSSTSVTAEFAEKHFTDRNAWMEKQVIELCDLEAGDLQWAGCMLRESPDITGERIVEIWLLAKRRNQLAGIYNELCSMVHGDEKYRKQTAEKIGEALNRLA